MAGMRTVVLFAMLLGGAALSTDTRANGSVHGFVYAEGTSLGLAGATINLAGGCNLGGFCTYSVNATSAADGSFSVSNLPAGNYTASAYYYPVATGNYLSTSQPTGVSDGMASTVTLYMKPGATISGKVTRASDNASAENIRIVLQETTPILDNVSSAVSDAEGNYQFTQIKAGDYRLLIRPPDTGEPYQSQMYSGHPLTPPSQGPQAADIVTMQTGQHVENVDVSLASGGVIRGVLTDRYTNLPISNVTDITFYLFDAADANGYPWETFDAPTDSQGQYEIRGLPDAPVILGVFSYVPYYALSIYKCSPDPCADRTVSPVLSAQTGTTIENINLTLFPGSVIKGTVSSTIDGTWIPGATIHAISPLFGGAIIGSTTTDAYGRFTLVGMEPNIYMEVLNASSNGQAFISQDFSTHDCVHGVCAPLSSDVVPAPTYKVTSGINFALVPGRAIKGQIRSSGDNQGIQGYVTLYSGDGTRGATVTSDATGHYATSGLQAGNYYLEAYIVNDVGGDCRAYPSIPCADVTSITNQSQPVAVGTVHDTLGINFSLIADRVFKSEFELF